MSYTRIHRLLRIITLIQSDPGWTAKRLAEECAVDERTIFRDFNELEGVGIPYFFDPDTGGYRIGKDFFLPPVQLSPDEALALAVLCEQVAQSDQIAYLRPAWRAMAKVMAALPVSVRDEVAGLARATTIRTAASMPGDGHQDVYEQIRDAILDRTALVCRYESNSGESDAEEFDFEPYSLMFAMRAWYAIGFHAGRAGVRTLKLSRFAMIRPTHRPYQIPPTFSVDAHLGNAWRMIRGTPDHAVEIRFDAAFAQTVSDTRWHKTQEFEFHPDGSTTFRCTVSGLDEIVWWVLSHGPHCRVIKPPELAERIRQHAKDTLDLYAAPA
ncbi:MAG TPA: YafY family protein [Phycisphaerales bacterium]|nr:YafY family protein [Phycisphaerales bacterium]